MESQITGNTKVICLIGNPVEHTISPTLHNNISRLLGEDLIYTAFRVEPGELENAVKGLKALNVVGFNVTVPYKNDIIPFLDELSTEAKLIGAVNTVKNVNGRLIGFNTDAEGFSMSFKEETGIPFTGKSIAVIGAGGAARAVAVKTALEGAGKITVINRTLTKAEDIADIINNNIREIAASCTPEENAFRRILEDSDIIINTTSLGMFPKVETSPLDFPFKFNKDQILYDVVYNPAKTLFLRQGEQAGCKTVNGLGMLFYQGAKAYEIWTEKSLSHDLVISIFRDFP